MKLAFYIFLLSAIDICAISTSKQWQVSGKIYWLIVSMILFATMPIVFAQATRLEASAIVNATWVAASSILIAVSGYFIFKETLSITQIIGLLVIVTGLVLMEFK